MGILDTLKNKVEEVENHFEQTQASVAHETPEEPSEEVEQTQIAASDRSAYNCPDCKGEGLTADQTARCGTCYGTGKVN